MLKIVCTLCAVMVSLGLAWPDLSRPIITAADGERYTAGQIIIELNPALRGEVAQTEQDGIALFSVPALDELGRRYKVDDISQLMRDPNPSPAAKELGCDLQYCVQFDQTIDVRAAIQAYEELDEVEYACPNAWLELDKTDASGSLTDELPDDPHYNVQWHLAKIGAPFAWAVAKGDTNVLALVLDDGLDWVHPDIEANVWVNPLEDLNGNGRFDTLYAPEGDLDFVDNDGNGYTDDVIGFDLVGGDPNPMPSYPDYHGTHTWGIVNAVTDNNEGIAAAPWNARGMAVRCGHSGGINLGAAVNAIYYGVPKGIWCVSMSFGSSSPYTPLANACTYAWNEGCVLFASAGNDGVEIRRYPACGASVENTAASNSSDMKASFSTYGTWVDVTAPGDGIYSTVPRANGSYAGASGTSMSCPLAAGVACWLKSLDPTLTNVQCTSRMHAACESMPDPLFTQGKLGAGRVSMANVVLPLYYCDLKITDWRFNDASGNGNGRPDPGETAALIVTYHNRAGFQDAGEVSATLTASSGQIQIVKGTATFPDIAADSSRDCSADSFVISIPPTTPPQEYEFYLTVDADPDPAYPNANFSVISGDPRVLIVDDDMDGDYLRWYTAACDSNGVLYHTYDVEGSGPPSNDTLKCYPVVFWFCGDDAATTLTHAERTCLVDFLDNGGNLLISGKNIAQDISDEPFLADYLHAQLVDTSTGKPFFVGIPGDPITAGDTLVAGGGGGGNNGTSLDGVLPLNGAVGCAFFKDYTDTTTQAVIRYSGDYKLVYFSTPFEAIDHSVSRYVQKWELVRRILLWFGEGVPGVNANPVPPVDRLPYVLQVSPNPFSRSCRVEFIAPVTGRVELRTYGLDGRLVDSQSRMVTLMERTGFELDGSRLTNGLYVVQLVTPEGVFAQKVAVLK